jgi:hypothetical protein
MPLKYAILLHSQIDEPHYDILFETSPGSQLAAFRSPVWPIDQPVELTQLRDHRRIYLTYEGEIPDHRGHVTRIAAGECDVRPASKDEIAMEIAGGKLTLTRIDGTRWDASV